MNPAHGDLLQSHHGRVDGRRISGCRPGDVNIISGPFNSWERTRRHTRSAGNIERSADCSVGFDLAKPNFRLLSASFDPTDDRGTRCQANDVDATLWIAVINLDRFTERFAAIDRKCNV